MKLNAYLMNSKWIKDLNIRAKTSAKTTRLGNDFLHMTPKHRQQKKKR
jgi:hypothetical protein